MKSTNSTTSDPPVNAHGAFNEWCRIAGIPVKAKNCHQCVLADAIALVERTGIQIREGWQEWLPHDRKENLRGLADHMETLRDALDGLAAHAFRVGEICCEVNGDGHRGPCPDVQRYGRIRDRALAGIVGIANVYLWKVTL